MTRGPGAGTRPVKSVFQSGARLGG